ncbi:Calcineurin-like phosphoesterase superfamily protein [Arboricoccus pini]|uniref:Calcineurin-like phosphoesterase superfamily protein n=1 Tax=Arboricoccus pini TaxID=1963835 RepID=A0A212RDC2_9PROT|nr:metallophosphoesterase family protein [Arboricoccus pini]SNB70300.1 Calcineurin-like phosphoesterase superfamily protein [Arboricoccus pini]
MERPAAAGQRPEGAADGYGLDALALEEVDGWLRIWHERKETSMAPGGKVWFTSDTHFNDPRVLGIDRRPYATLALHDAALEAGWNEVVAASDEVWHLGDVARLSKAEIGSLLGRLNGVKHLIVGNNDGASTLEAEGWASVRTYHELFLEGRHLILCHYPFRTWNQMGRKSIDLHGHSHGALSPMTRQYDVGVDVWSYRPVDLATILATRRRAARGGGVKRLATGEGEER